MDQRGKNENRKEEKYVKQFNSDKKSLKSHFSAAYKIGEELTFKTNTVKFGDKELFCHPKIVP